MPFIRLSNTPVFTVTEFKGYKFKKWDVTENKMLVSDTYQDGYRKMYTLETAEGTLDVSQSQLGQMLSGVCVNGVANIIGQTFSVKTNGKQGLEVRYWINPLNTSTARQQMETARSYAQNVPDGFEAIPPSQAPNPIREVQVDDIPW